MYLKRLLKIKECFCWLTVRNSLLEFYVGRHRGGQNEFDYSIEYNTELKTIGGRGAGRGFEPEESRFRPSSTSVGSIQGKFSMGVLYMINNWRKIDLT